MDNRSQTMQAVQTAGNILYYPLMLLAAALAAVEFSSALSWGATHPGVYLWFAAGMAAYFLIRRIPAAGSNEAWMQTFSHELSHTLVGMLFLHKIHTFHVGERSGNMTHSGRGFGAIFISLAPYCLPVFTYLLIFIRLIGDEKAFYIFDLLIGFTLAFHATCFYTQTRPYQTDIQSQGYSRAYLFILVCWIFNATVVLLSVRMGFGKAIAEIATSSWQTLGQWWHAIAA